MLTGSARRLLPLVLPALVVGAACSLILLAIDLVAEQLQHLLWDGLPGWFGVPEDTWWWTLLMLTAVGVAVGLVIWLVPTGPDPATEGLVAPPLPVRVVPGTLLAAVLCLAGGVSLGPENPIIVANVALAVALGARFLSTVQTPMWAGLAVAGTIGALFGTPVAAALLLSEAAVGPKDVPLWDRIFAPLVSAGAGSAVTVVIARPVFALDVPDYSLQWGDLITASCIAAVGALLGLAAVYAFPHFHSVFRRIGHPLARLTVGGLLLGVLGAIGGQITLFKGLAEMKELTAELALYTAAGLLLIVLIKVLALLVSATAGFIGGRIFPSVFIGAALGMLANSLFPNIPLALAIGSGVLGVVLAITQQGWISLFTAAAMLADTELLPVLCLAILPAWLLVTGKPPMQVEEAEAGIVRAG
ncbi:ion channel protein [Nonomuraea soli]|uniref:H+/Cl- antiporter ClcA n=1 Tax=Nonomuraea soli TaxID=1032476 RepID=A0A7W0CJB5_9ACTN|nr:ion channel protein [Nonomuraea soli]MBA2891977.1 H+/Cl- antiporter ClcA [Nonomuraea soli]